MLEALGTIRPTSMNLAINKSLIRANSASAALAIVERRVRDFNAINLGTA